MLEISNRCLDGACIIEAEGGVCLTDGFGIIRCDDDMFCTDFEPNGLGGCAPAFAGSNTHLRHGIAPDVPDRILFENLGVNDVVIAVSDGNGACPGNLRAELRRASGALVATSTDDGPGDCPAFSRQLLADVYVLLVFDEDRDFGETAYTVDIQSP